MYRAPYGANKNNMLSFIFIIYKSYNSSPQRKTEKKSPKWKLFYTSPGSVTSDKYLICKMLKRDTKGGSTKLCKAGIFLKSLHFVKYEVRKDLRVPIQICIDRDLESLFLKTPLLIEKAD